MCNLLVTTRAALATSSDVYTDKGKLYYHSQVFDKGKDVFIEAKQENGKWQGTIVVVNPAEVVSVFADDIRYT